MPLTEFQKSLATLLARNRTPDSHLAGGAAIHFEPHSKRFSNDLDYFHDSIERVADAFARDRALLEEHGFEVTIEMQQPGYIRCRVRKARDITKIEWAHDTAWRFMPVLADPDAGYRLHPIDLAINKMLALVGRDEPRDFLDILYVHSTVLPIGALCWAAAGKDPGFTPLSLLELLKRRGRYRAEDFQRLHLTEPVNLVELKQKWLEALEEADRFIRSRPAEESGCLYYAPELQKFVAPGLREATDPTLAVIPHYGRPGGLLPKMADSATRE